MHTELLLGRIYMLTLTFFGAPESRVQCRGLSCKPRRRCPVRTPPPAPNDTAPRLAKPDPRHGRKYLRGRIHNMACSSEEDEVLPTSLYLTSDEAQSINVDGRGGPQICKLSGPASDLETGVVSSTKSPST